MRTELLNTYLRGRLSKTCQNERHKRMYTDGILRIPAGKIRSQSENARRIARTRYFNLANNLLI